MGSVIAETYTIEGLLGRGGMGAVFVASHARLPGKKVAIKVLHPDVADAESLARFRREAEIASRLGHPNIVEVHDWNQLPDGTPYLVLELLVGESLADRLKAGPMSMAEVIPVVRQVGAALVAAHREGIVHRDLKPANIFLIPQDEGPPRTKVLDFGISKIRGSSTVQTQDTQMLGTPQYMAPEQATGRHHEVDGRTDVFALGAVVFEMLTGQAAFGGTTIPEVVFKVVFEPAPSVASFVPGVPANVVAAIDRALEKKVDDRWPDVGAFVEAVTGSPLATGRVPVPTAVRAAAAGPATPVKQSTQDAFAQTMGSGDHAAAMVAQSRAALAAGPVASAATVATMTTPVAGAPRKRTGLIVGAVVLVAAAAAAAVVLTKGGGGGAAATAPIDAAVVAMVTVDAGAAPPDAEALTLDGGAATLDAGAVPLDAGAAPLDAAGPRPDARPSTPRPDAGTTGTTGGGDDDEEPAGLRPLVAAARAALRGGDPDAALKLSRAALNEFPDAQALFAIRAEAYCMNDDQGAAQTAFRKVKKPKLRGPVKRACKDAGYELM